ncbi:MAG: PAS domain S-box protein, partial [Syntrophaceae bacterium]|nr:PAS domain S-box protein [Syntrophaceae bacterium]
MKKQLLQWYRSASSVWDERSTSRLHLLVVSRMAILFVLLLLVIMMEKSMAEPLMAMSLRLFYLLITTAFFLSLLYFLLIRKIRRLAFHVYLQALFDVCLITGLVYVTGGVRSVYPVFYPLVIIYSVVFLGRHGGLIVASLSSIFYGLFVNFEFYGLIDSLHLQPEATVSDHRLEYSGYVFFRVLVHILSFYLITFIASFVVGQERKIRQLLREKEFAFAELDSLHQSIVESVNTGILTVDLYGRVKSFNRAAEEIMGLTSTDALDKNILDIIPEYREIYIGEKSKEDDHAKRQRAEIVIHGKETGPTVLGCALSPLKGNGDKTVGHILIFQDITRIKEMEQAYEESRKMAFIGEMAAILAHEIRNPLASISGSIQVLRKSLSLNSVDERLFQIILRGKDQLESFIKDFLILARPAVGTHEEVDVSALLDEILESVKLGPSWHEGVDIDAVYPKEVRFTANRTELRQLMWNLVLNGLQAMPEGGRMNIDLSLENTSDNGRWLTVRVADQGMGIEETDMKKIFDPFFTTKEQGTGLGLAIVNRIVTVYGGNL